MSMTLAQARSRVRARLDEATETFWTDDNLDVWINEGARDLSRRTETLLTSDVTNPVTAGVATVAAPTNVLRIYMVEWERDGDDRVKELEYRDRKQMPAVWWESQDISSGEPWCYTTDGYPPSLTLRLYPTPSDAGNLRIHYYASSTDATDDSDTVTTPNGWDDLILDYAEFRALRVDGDARWQSAFQIYEGNVARMLETTRRFVEGVGGIVETNGGPLPAWLVEMA